MTTALATLTSKLAAKLEMGDGAGLVETLKATAFKGQVSDAQMTALMVVANQYGLNPWTKEIYAFPDKQNGIVPVVGLDGWSRIINNHPQFDGMDFEQDSESCTCIIHRKDRGHPVKVTEWMEECYRPAFKNREGYEVKGPWQSHPKRMLRHKSMIQCARLAFGYTGIYEQDEAERIVEAERVVTGEVIRDEAKQPEALPPCPPEKFAASLAEWGRHIASKAITAEALIAKAQARYTMTDAQVEAIRDLGNLSVDAVMSDAKEVA